MSDQRTQSLVSLPAGTTTGTGNMLDNDGSMANHSIVVTGSAGISAGAVALQLSHDNQNWFQPTTGQPAVTASTVTVGNFSGIPARFVRAVVTTNITGGTVAVTIASA
jgi:hypothetical protein